MVCVPDPHACIPALLCCVATVSVKLPCRDGADSSSDDEGDDGNHSGGGGDSSSSGSGSEDEAGVDWVSEFPGLEQQIRDAIQDLGGSVVPKLNWSCPWDARWVNPGGALCCTNAEEVRLAMRHSGGGDDHHGGGLVHKGGVASALPCHAKGQSLPSL